MELTELRIGDIVKHTSANDVVNEMTIREIETKGIQGQSHENPNYVCSFFSKKTQDLEHRSFLRHEIEFVKRPERI